MEDIEDYERIGGLKNAISILLTQMYALGKAYVNIETHQNPNGEIRGQLKPLSSQQ